MSQINPRARILDVRDAIVQAINADSADNQAKECYLAEYHLANLRVMQVDVRVLREDTAALAREPSSEDVYFLEITVQKDASPFDIDRLDALVTLSKRIAKLFYPNMELAGLTPPVVVVQNDHEFYDLQVLRDYGAFRSTIQLALREFVDD